MLERLTVCAAISVVAPALAQAPQFGQPIAPADIAPWDISIGPDGAGLPPGRGTLFDYIRRAMPFQESQSLTSDEVYAVSAYILNLNGIIGANDVLDAQSLPKVRMPNQDGFIPFPRNPKYLCWRIILS